MRTTSEPARARAATWSAVERASSVSVLVMDCTRMGAAPPTTLSAMRTAREGRRVIMANLLDGDAGHAHAGVRLQVVRAVVEGHLHAGGVADDDGEGRAAGDLGSAARGIEFRHQRAATRVAD